MGLPPSLTFLDVCCGKNPANLIGYPGPTTAPGPTFDTSGNFWVAGGGGGAGNPPLGNPTSRGVGGAFEVLTWDGELVWEYELSNNNYQHHYYNYRDHNNNRVYPAYL